MSKSRPWHGFWQTVKVATLIRDEFSMVGWFHNGNGGAIEHIWSTTVAIESGELLARGLRRRGYVDCCRSYPSARQLQRYSSLNVTGRVDQSAVVTPPLFPGVYRERDGCYVTTKTFLVNFHWPPTIDNFVAVSILAATRYPYFFKAVRTLFLNCFVFGV